VLRREVEETIEKVRARHGEAGAAKIDIKIGTMIEVPRAALVADQIARHADFFSFGTNDLTQMTFGYSRDDVGKFLPAYLEQGLLPVDPFASVDTTGVGQLVDIACKGGRKTKAKLKLGVCGEHGGDPRSIVFFDGVGLDYVSCSPYMVPIAWLASAQAQINQPRPAASQPRVAARRRSHA
jgi:pyruvate,orthophosphate dikinase